MLVWKKYHETELKYIVRHENIIAYLNWPIDESESYGNCTEVDLSIDVTYVLGEIGVTATFGI